MNVSVARSYYALFHTPLRGSSDMNDTQPLVIPPTLSPSVDAKPQLGGSRVAGQFKDVPEWKRAVQGGTRSGTVGKKIVRSILEQRQALPIYKLKDELLKVRSTMMSTIKMIGMMMIIERVLSI